MTHNPHHPEDQAPDNNGADTQKDHRSATPPTPERPRASAIPGEASEGKGQSSPQESQNKASKTEPQKAVRKTIPELSPTLLKDWQILVVDDEPDSLAVAKLLLEFAGATVFTARDGREGLKMAQKHRPLFILSDLSMPLLDGYGLLEALQADPELKDTPVIALTAHAMRGDRERAMQAGFHYYITKPLRPETFVNEVLTLLLNVPAVARRLDPDQNAKGNS